MGDDRIQKQTRGYAVPDSFTHGTSAQRVRCLGAFSASLLESRHDLNMSLHALKMEIRSGER